MKGIYIVIALTAFVGFGNGASIETQMEDALSKLSFILNSNLEKQINAALSGQQIEEESLTAQMKTFAAGVPILPNTVYLKGNLDNAVVFGLENLVPKVNMNIIKKTLDIQFNLPQVRIEGDYKLAVSAAEDFESLHIIGGSGLGKIAANDFVLDINAKLKGTIFTGFKIDYLDYTFAPFAVSTDLDEFLLFNNVQVGEYVQYFLDWYIYKELVDAEGKLHEPLVEYAINVINKILCPIC